MDMSFEIASENMHDKCDSGEKSLLFTKRKERLNASGKHSG